MDLAAHMALEERSTILLQLQRQKRKKRKSWVTNNPWNYF
jgi:hypothetical protein